MATSSTPSSASSIAAIGLALALLGGAGWWFGVHRPAELRRAAEQAAAEAAAAEAALQARRRDWFGEVADQPGFTFRPSGLGHRIVTRGEGPAPGPHSTVRLTYTGRLRDGRVFDSVSKPSVFRLNALLPGLGAGLPLIGPGGRIELLIPPSLGYGNRAAGGIPPGSGLIFDVTLVFIEP
jgi:FKBP-type peptidyl-prolyl cis-trans isomerase